MKEPEEVPEEEDDMADFLARLEAVSARKLAKAFSTIQRDEVGHRTVQVAVPTVDKSREEITPLEYAITIVDLGPTTKGHEMEELDNSVSTIKARLEKEIATKKDYKREVERLKEYIQHLTKPFDLTSSAAPPLMNTSHETLEEEKNIAKETK